MPIILVAPANSFSWAFLAYVPPELAIRRIKSRPSECDRHLNETLLINVAAQFKAMARREKFITLDTARAPEDAFIAVQKTLRDRGIL